MGNLKKEQKEKLEIINTATEKKNAFDGLIPPLERAEERNLWARGNINRILENQKAKKTISNDHGKTTHKKSNRNDRKRKKVGTEEISK